MKLNTKLLKFLFIVIFLSSLPLQVVYGANAGLVHSYLAEEPSIDGVLETDIWQPTRKLDVDLYNYEDQSEILTMSLMSVYCEENASITFSLEFPDSTDDNDYLMMVFKTNTTGDLVFYDTNPITLGWGFSPNNDIKLYQTFSSTGTDMKTAGFNFDLYTDTGAGGTNDVLAATHQLSGNIITIEFMFKLDSGDVDGADISLSRDGTVEFFLFYQQDNSKLYTQIRTDDNNWDHCILQIGKPGLLGPGLLFIIGSLIATLFVVSYKKRK